MRRSPQEWKEESNVNYTNTHAYEPICRETARRASASPRKEEDYDDEDCVDIDSNNSEQKWNEEMIRRRIDEKKRTSEEKMKKTR